MNKPLTILFHPPAKVNVAMQLIHYACDQRKECGVHVTKGASHTHNPFLKRISTWLLLKNLTTSGLIKNYGTQVKDIATYCMIAQSTLYRDISWLKAEGLLFRQGKHLRIASWKTIEENYGINTAEKLHIEYEPSIKPWHLADALAAINDKSHRDVCYAAYLRKINGNPREKLEVTNHVYEYNKATPLQRLHSDDECLRKLFLKVKVDSYRKENVGQSSFEFLHKRVKANPDIEMCIGTYGKKDHFKVRKKKDKRGRSTMQSMGYYHRMRKLQKLGLITVQRRKAVSKHCARKDESIFYHRYIPKKKATVWVLCNKQTLNEEEIFGKKTVA